MNLVREKTRAGSPKAASCWQGIRRIAVVGEAMFEQQHDGKPDPAGDPVYGGDAINFAIYLVRILGQLNAPVSVEFISALGNDSQSKALLRAWQREKLVCSQVKLDPRSATGRYRIQLAPDGERSFSYQRTGSAASRSLTALPVGWSNGFDAIYLTGITLAILNSDGRERMLNELEGFVAAGGRLIFDSNFRADLWQSDAQARAGIGQAKRLASLSLLTLADEQALYQQPMQAEQLSVPAETVVKCGAAPAWIYTDHAPVSVPAESAVVRDTTAAGDAFNAAYLASRLVGMGPRRAAQNGHRLAASVIAEFGAIIAATAIPQMLRCRAPAMRS